MNPPDFTHAVWRKSSRSGGNGGQCVEVTVVGTAVGVRDSKDGGRGPILIFAPREWKAFIGVVANEESNRT